MSDDETRNYGTTRQIVTGKIKTTVAWCAVDPAFPIASLAQVWWSDKGTAEFFSGGRPLAQRVQQISTSYITEEATKRAEYCSVCGEERGPHVLHPNCYTGD